MPKEDLIYEQSFAIKAPISKVWDALINPQVTKQYMFGCEAISDWEIGRSLSWRGAEDGVDYVIGFVLKFEPESVLSFSTFAPNAGYQDVPENYLDTEYTLSFANGETTINVWQGGFSLAEDGENRYEESAKSWEMTCDALKKLLEE